MNGTVIYLLSEHIPKLGKDGQPGALIIRDPEQMMNYGVRTPGALALLILHPDNLEMVKRHVTDYDLVPIWEQDPPGAPDT